MWRLVFRLANRLSEEPACSNMDQNSADARNNTRIAADLFLSVGDQPRPNISQEKTAVEITTSATPSALEIAVTSTKPTAASAPTVAKSTNPAAVPNKARRFWRRPC